MKKEIMLCVLSFVFFMSFSILINAKENEVILYSGVTQALYEIQSEQIGKEASIKVHTRYIHGCLTDEERLINDEMHINNEINITDKKEWFKCYKNIIDKYSYCFDPPEEIYDYYTDNELNLFFRVVQAEIGDEYSFDQKCNVASVILNRIADENFPDKIGEILTSDQFQTIRNGRFINIEISDDTILACEYVFMFGDTTDGCLFFDSDNTLKYKFSFFDGAHNFYKLENAN